MSHFLLTTAPHDRRLTEVVPHFLYSSTSPSPLRNTRDVIVFLHGTFTNLTTLRGEAQGNDLSPEEIIAALYVTNRRFSGIDGYFSAVIVDLHRRALIGITDKHCVGELYYHIAQQGHVTIASRFAALLPYSEKRLNDRALACFFSLGDTDRPDTLVEDIRRITQFHTLHLDDRLTIHSDYLAALSSLPVHRSRDRKEVLDNLESLLRSYIKNLTAEYGHLCNTLSGGVDSSYLQALLLEEGQVHSFSIAFAAAGLDNVYASDVAQHLGTTHEAISFDSDEFLQYIERGITVTGKPFMYQGEAMFLKLYDHIATRFPGTTVISGQTADGALDSALSRPIQLALTLNLVPHHLLDLLLGYVSPEWRGLTVALRSARISSETLRRIARHSDTCARVARYLGCSHDMYAPIAAMANGFTGGTEDKLAKAHLYGGEMRRIPHMLHALAESVGLRTALPFLEPSFLEYTLTIPAVLKRRKYLGKKLAARHIPRAYVYRPKISKRIPYGRLFTQEAPWVDLLNAIRRARYYGFDVDEMIADAEHLLLLRLINFHIWKRRVLASE